ncbi:MAG: hypothetical protein UT13_C0001G0314 [Candidatus Pacebacteria bacterium GW2011_GWF2_38_9]|nr:MAG: hypothetical protein US01_C0001G0322 [candidate division TM6 bacterium GW2011_GWF2_28_16]KKQ10303.1 MAG: hypothetical protein US20_C0001G0017 [Candidatus Pacebacteria bacterium GW2011_GWF1_36_5]KKQ88667.1 MAG: hypothetical protein UT13_C0001G0314 [Candidatus Pacebacteria bacterium GW2011_GWF2_38_9]HAZ73687.1 hypothetical protein [Candidatus Paceibacterota bacterium]
MPVISYLLTAFFIGGGIYCIFQYWKVEHIEREINVLETEWDGVPKKSMNPYVNNDTLLKIIAKNRQPIERKIYLLKQKRQFVLDKIPLIGWFKK